MSGPVGNQFTDIVLKVSLTTMMILSATIQGCLEKLESTSPLENYQSEEWFELNIEVNGTNETDWEIWLPVPTTRPEDGSLTTESEPIPLIHRMVESNDSASLRTWNDSRMLKVTGKGDTGEVRFHESRTYDGPGESMYSFSTLHMMDLESIHGVWMHLNASNGVNVSLSWAYHLDEDYNCDPLDVHLDPTRQPVWAQGRGAPTFELDPGTTEVYLFYQGGGCWD